MMIPALATRVPPMMVMVPGTSLQNTRPNTTAQIIPEYSNGATKLAGPIR